MTYHCRTCSARFPLALSRFRCDCGAPLDLEFESAPLDRATLGLRPRTIWRWHETLPFGERLPGICLGEGWSPVVEDRLGEVPVHLALEYISPTGSYKDRGTSLLVAAAAAMGATDVVDDTSGNAGISLAAHARRAGLGVRLLVPEDAHPAKPHLAEALGAEVVRVAGGRAGAADAAVREARQGAFYASHAWSPFFLHGVKTLAFTLCESLGWEVPGAVLAPLGNGGLVLGLERGFRELRRQGLIDRRPALVGVQAERCAPLARAFERDLPSPVPVEEAPTAADGVRVGAPPRGAEVLEAIRASGGAVASVTEEEIEDARCALWDRGYVVEPTGSVAAALVRRSGTALRARWGDLAVVLSGSGLKRPA